MHWKNKNIPQHTSPDDSDDNIDMNGARGAPRTPEELAIDWAASARWRQCAGYEYAIYYLPFQMFI